MSENSRQAAHRPKKGHPFLIETGMAFLSD